MTALNSQGPGKRTVLEQRVFTKRWSKHKGVALTSFDFRKIKVENIITELPGATSAERVRDIHRNQEHKTIFKVLKVNLLSILVLSFTSKPSGSSCF